jgi:hypothetical protein
MTTAPRTLTFALARRTRSAVELVRVAADAVVAVAAATSAVEAARRRRAASVTCEHPRRP